MTKLEKEKAIINEITNLVDRYNDLDNSKRELIKHETENGTNPSFWDDVFFYNGYIFTTELTDIISKVLFGHHSEERISYDSRFKGVPRGHNYRNILTTDETNKINKVMLGMVEANIIRFSKSKTMVKLLKKED